MIFSVSDTGIYFEKKKISSALFRSRNYDLLVTNLDVLPLGTGDSNHLNLVCLMALTRTSKSPVEMLYRASGLKVMSPTENQYYLVIYFKCQAKNSSHL